MICGNDIFQISSPHSPLFVTDPPFFESFAASQVLLVLPNILTYRNPEAVRTWDLQGIYMGFIWTFYMAFIWDSKVSLVKLLFKVSRCKWVEFQLYVAPTEFIPRNSWG